MKNSSVVSYSNYPILEKLHKGSLGIMPIFEKDKIFFELDENFGSNWKFYHKNFQQEINVIRKPFYEASIKAEKKLMQLWRDIIINDTSDFDVKGCYLFGNLVYMIDYEIKKGSEDNETAFYIFDKKGMPLAMYINSTKYKINFIWISSCFSVGNSPTEIETWIYKKIAQIIVLKMFKTYAEVETKIIPPNSRIKDINCKHINDTKFQLTYLDSKWFTNLIKSDAFTVSGHFRLQPKKKNDEWTKELIWISEFEKTGYNSPARIIEYNKSTEEQEKQFMIDNGLGDADMQNDITYPRT